MIVKLKTSQRFVSSSIVVYGGGGCLGHSAKFRISKERGAVIQQPASKWDVRVDLNMFSTFIEITFLHFAGV